MSSPARLGPGIGHGSTAVGYRTAAAVKRHWRSGGNVVLVRARFRNKGIER